MWLRVGVRLALLTALASAQLIDFYEPWVPQSALFEPQKNRPIVYSFESLSPKREQSRAPTCRQLRRIWRRLSQEQFRRRRTQVGKDFEERKPDSQRFRDPAKDIYGVLKARSRFDSRPNNDELYGVLRTEDNLKSDDKSFLDEIRAHLYPEQEYDDKIAYGSVIDAPKGETSAFERLRQLVQQEEQQQQQREGAFEQVRQRLMEERKQQRMLRRQEGRRRREARLRRLHHNAHLGLQHRPWPIYRY